MFEIYSTVTVPKITEISWHSTKLLQKTKKVQFFETQCTLHAQIASALIILEITTNINIRLIYPVVLIKTQPWPAGITPSAYHVSYVTVGKYRKGGVRQQPIISWDNRCYSIANFNFNLKLMLKKLNILSHKQTKYCRKLTRLNNIKYASKNLFTSCN